MIILSRILFVVSLLVFAAPAMATQQINPIVFTRSTITVISIPKQADKNKKEEDAAKEKAKDDAKKEDAKDKKEKPADKTDDKNKKEEKDVKSDESDKIIKHYFNVEIRTPDALNMEWFYRLESMKEKEGIMITYPLPQVITLNPAKIYKPVDVVFINEEGVIKAIAPSIVLSNITKAVQPDAPMKAMLFLKGGTTQDLDISPGDTVVHPDFVSEPLILH